MSILITGSRHAQPDIKNYSEIMLLVARHMGESKPTMLVHGDAPGIDSLGAALAEDWDDWRACAHPADWKTHGKAAGPKRNQEMLDEHPEIELVLAFPDPKSKGTWDMVKRAVNKHIPVRVYLIEIAEDDMT